MKIKMDALTFRKPHRLPPRPRINTRLLADLPEGTLETAATILKNHTTVENWGQLEHVPAEQALAMEIAFSARRMLQLMVCQRYNADRMGENPGVWKRLLPGK